MKAWVYKKYGPPIKVLTFTEMATPLPLAHEVLIEIYATAINDYDWNAVTGKPWIYQLLYGWGKPKRAIPGMELSGVVTQVGEKVSQWQVGDEVYGDISAYGFGSYATYIAINENAVRRKPSKMSFLHAVALPHAGLLAIQALRDLGNIQSHQKILINGGGGGVGLLALQLAKSFNCEVTGVDTGPKLAVMKSMGYNQVIDYQKQNFTTQSSTYDLILDCKTNQWPLNYLKVLKPKGKYLTIGGDLSRLLQVLIMGLIARLLTSKKLQVLVLKPNERMEYVQELHEKGVFTPVIDGPYTMDEIPRLVQYFGEGKHTGKVVIKIK